MITRWNLRKLYEIQLERADCLRKPEPFPFQDFGAWQDRSLLCQDELARKFWNSVQQATCPEGTITREQFEAWTQKDLNCRGLPINALLSLTAQSQSTVQDDLRMSIHSDPAQGLAWKLEPLARI